MGSMRQGQGSASSLTALLLIGLLVLGQGQAEVEGFPAVQAHMGLPATVVPKMMDKT